MNTQQFDGHQRTGNDASALNGKNANAQRLFIDCVHLVYANRARSIFSVFAFSIVPLLLGWHPRTRSISVLLVVVLWIYASANLYFSHRVKLSRLTWSGARRWAWVFYVQVSILGLLLNAIFLYFDAQGVPGALNFLMLVTMAFSAGAVSAYHYLKPTGPLFVGVAIAPQLVYFPLRLPEYGLLLDVVSVLFFVFMSLVGKELHDSAERTLTMGYELESAKEDAERRALTDALTGLDNRRSFFESAPPLLDAARERSRPVCLAVLDIDYFKRINDQHGHAAGDKVLVHVAGLLKAGMRDSDIVARVGGEEFAVLLPQTDLAGAVDIVERLRQDLHRIDLSAEGIPPISASFGVAEGGTWSLDELLERADSALYRAKDAGRDRTEVAAATAA
ncbi:MAG: GGDEF domain-containing protein [Rudaea sp.]